MELTKPKIAVLGLNPHCGDKGVIGKEDDEIIDQQFKKLKKTGKLFLVLMQQMVFLDLKLISNLMVVLATYHDQGLSAF